MGTAPESNKPTSEDRPSQRDLWQQFDEVELRRVMKKYYTVEDYVVIPREMMIHFIKKATK